MLWPVGARIFAVLCVCLSLCCAPWAHVYAVIHGCLCLWVHVSVLCSMGACRCCALWVYGSMQTVCC